MPDSLALELEAIKRGISRADLMREKSLEPRRIDSPTQGLAQLAQAFVARRAGQKADEKLAAFKSKYEAALEKEKADTLAEQTDKIEKKRESSTRKADLLISQGRLDPENKGNFIAANMAGETGLIKPSKSGFEELGKAFSDSLTSGGKSKVNREFLDLGKSTRKTLKQFDRIIDGIKKDPQSVTLGGTVGEGIASIDANLRGLGKTFGFDVDLIDTTINGIGGEAVKSASVRASIKKLVRDFARAKGEFGKALSDNDLVHFTKQITARWGNPAAINKVLLERRNELVNEFNIEKSVNQQTGFNTPDVKEFDFKVRAEDVADNPADEKPMVRRRFNRETGTFEEVK